MCISICSIIQLVVPFRSVDTVEDVLPLAVVLLRLGTGLCCDETASCWSPPSFSRALGLGKDETSKDR